MGRDRSRSRGGWGEWISRQIASFGRYPDKRPEGLYVDSNGEMQLSSLMDAWGRHHDLTEHDIKDAIEKHMYQDGRNGGAAVQRFTLNTDSTGDVSITVRQKKGAWGGRHAQVATPARARASNHEKEDAWNGKWASGDDKWEKDDGGWQGSERSESNTWNKDDRSWEENADDAWNKDKGWQESSWNRGGSWQRDKGKGVQRDTWEKVQRYLGWILKRGHEELCLTLDSGGWASMEDIAEAMHEKRPDLGITDEDSLQQMLQETDTAGRFEIEKGSVRKVDRDQRLPRTQASNGLQATAASEAADGWQAEEEETIPPEGAPSAPPGQHWQRYHDNGVQWWYYEGPLGKWWCQGDGSDYMPFPYTD